MDTYFGRLQQFQAINNPYNAFQSNISLYAFSKIFQSRSKLLFEFPNDKLLEMKLILDGCQNKSGQFIIPFIFRTNVYSMIKTPIVMGLSVLPQRGMIPYISQIVNQSQSAAQNQYNRNTTADNIFNQKQISQTSFDILVGQLITIVTALSIMFGAKKIILMMDMNLENGTGQWLGLMINVISSSVASMLNAVIMRWNESKGVQIYQKNGKQVYQIKDKSSVAGMEVLKAVAICKFMLSFLALSISIFAASYIHRSEQSQNIDEYKMFYIDGLIIFISQSISRPASLAIFDDEIKIKVENLEDKFIKYKHQNYVQAIKGV